MKNNILVLLACVFIIVVLVKSNPTPTIVKKELLMTIVQPESGVSVSAAAILVKGVTSAPNAEIFVNEHETRSDENGNFSVNYALEEGENFILILANDEIGNYIEEELIITYVPTQ